MWVGDKNGVCMQQLKLVPHDMSLTFATEHNSLQAVSPELPSRGCMSGALVVGSPGAGVTLHRHLAACIRAARVCHGMCGCGFAAPAFWAGASATAWASLNVTWQSGRAGWLKVRALGCEWCADPGVVVAYYIAVSCIAFRHKAATNCAQDSCTHVPALLARLLLDMCGHA